MAPKSSKIPPAKVCCDEAQDNKVRGNIPYDRESRGRKYQQTNLGRNNSRKGSRCMGGQQTELHRPFSTRNWESNKDSWTHKKIVWLPNGRSTRPAVQESGVAYLGIWTQHLATKPEDTLQWCWGCAAASHKTVGIPERQAIPRKTENPKTSYTGAPSTQEGHDRGLKVFAPILRNPKTKDDTGKRKGPPGTLSQTVEGQIDSTSGGTFLLTE